MPTHVSPTVVAPVSPRAAILAMRGHKHLKEFVDYHFANPDTYRFFVTTARQAKAKGFNRCSIKHLIEYGRWERGAAFSLAAGFSHNFQSLYARFIMAAESDLVGFFEIRKLKAM